MKIKQICTQYALEVLGAALTILILVHIFGRAHVVGFLILIFLLFTTR
jgi:hypothetical protein